jgi:hypothetical protein
MRRFINSYVIVMALVFGITTALPAWAQESSRTVKLNRASRLGGQSLPQGEYTVKFTEGKGGDAVFLRGKKEVVKAAYETTDLSAPASDTIVVFRAADDGSLQIARIEFKGMKTALVLK